MFSKKVFYCLLAALSISMAIFSKKIALLNGLPPLRLLLQFMIIAAFFLNINFFLFQRKNVLHIKKIKHNEWKMILLAGFFLFAAYMTSTFGLRYTTSINYSFIIRSSLFFSTILSFFFLGERIYREMSLLMISFFVGVYLVSTSGKIIIPQLGDLLILMGAFFFASFSVAQKLINHSIPSDLISWGVVSCSAIYSIVVGLLLKINLLSTEGLFMVLAAGVFEALVVVFMNQALKVTSVTYYYMMTMLTPIINGLLGFIFLNELFRPIQILGGMIIIVSILLAQKLKF